MFDADFLIVSLFVCLSALLTQPEKLAFSALEPSSAGQAQGSSEHNDVLFFKCVAPCTFLGSLADANASCGVVVV